MDANEAMLRAMGRIGGDTGARAVGAVIAEGRDVVETSRTVARTLVEVLGKLERAETALRLAEATIRAMVGAPLGNDVRVPIDPPAGHDWTTAGGDGGLNGRLVCHTCPVVDGPDGARAPLAAECLERARG